jgi:hypothetical protein
MAGATQYGSSPTLSRVRAIRIGMFYIIGSITVLSTAVGII